MVGRLTAGVLNPAPLALGLRALEPFDGTGGVPRVELDEREPLQHPDRADRVLGDDPPLGERPSHILLTDPAARTSIDEQLGPGRYPVDLASGAAFVPAGGQPLIAG